MEMEQEQSNLPLNTIQMYEHQPLLDETERNELARACDAIQPPLQAPTICQDLQISRVDEQTCEPDAITLEDIPPDKVVKFYHRRPREGRFKMHCHDVTALKQAMIREVDPDTGVVSYKLGEFKDPLVRIPLTTEQQERIRRHPVPIDPEDLKALKEGTRLRRQAARAQLLAMVQADLEWLQRENARYYNERNLELVKFDLTPTEFEELKHDIVSKRDVILADDKYLSKTQASQVLDFLIDQLHDFALARSFMADIRLFIRMPSSQKLHDMGVALAHGHDYFTDGSDGEWGFNDDDIEQIHDAMLQELNRRGGILEEILERDPRVLFDEYVAHLSLTRLLEEKRQKITEQENLSLIPELARRLRPYWFSVTQLAAAWNAATHNVYIDQRIDPQQTLNEARQRVSMDIADSSEEGRIADYLDNLSEWETANAEFRVIRSRYWDDPIALWYILGKPTDVQTGSLDELRQRLGEQAEMEFRQQGNILSDYELGGYSNFLEDWLELPTEYAKQEPERLRLKAVLFGAIHEPAVIALRVEDYIADRLPLLTKLLRQPVTVGKQRIPRQRWNQKVILDNLLGHYTENLQQAQEQIKEISTTVVGLYTLLQWLGAASPHAPPSVDTAMPTEGERTQLKTQAYTYYHENIWRGRQVQMTQQNMWREPGALVPVLVAAEKAHFYNAWAVFHTDGTLMFVNMQHLEQARQGMMSHAELEWESPYAFYFKDEASDTRLELRKDHLLLAKYVWDSDMYNAIWFGVLRGVESNKPYQGMWKLAKMHRRRLTQALQQEQRDTPANKKWDHWLLAQRLRFLDGYRWFYVPKYRNGMMQLDAIIEDAKRGHVQPNGDTVWTDEKGQLHRDHDMPAMISQDGTLMWYQHDQLHRDSDLPAVVDAHPFDRRETPLLEFYQHGRKHRDGDLPARVYRWLEHGMELQWFQQDHAKRDDGLPAKVRERWESRDVTEVSFPS